MIRKEFKFESKLSKERKSKQKFPELDQSMELVLKTKCPSKWTLIDQETGQIYEGTANPEIGKQWKKIK